MSCECHFKYRNSARAEASGKPQSKETRYRLLFKSIRHAEIRFRNLQIFQTFTIFRRNAYLQAEKRKRKYFENDKFSKNKPGFSTGLIHAISNIQSILYSSPLSCRTLTNS